MPEAPILEGYRAALESAAVFPDRARRVVEVSGARARRVVNGLVTNSIEGIEEGRARYSFLLDPKGRAITDLRILPPLAILRGGETDGEALWLDVPDASYELVQAHLERYVPPIFASVRSLDLRVITIWGPTAADVLAAGLREVGLAASWDVDLARTLDVAAVGSEGLVVASDEREGAGFDLYVTRRGGSALADALISTAGGGTEATLDAWDVLRIERGLPIAGRELTPDRLAQEAGQDDRAISFEKGCFTGQEVVARIHYRGHVNRHLRGLRAPQPGDLAGDTLFLGERPAGAVTSRAHSPRFGEIALGYVRREVEPGAKLSAQPGGPSLIEVVDLPFTHK